MRMLLYVVEMSGTFRLRGRQHEVFALAICLTTEINQFTAPFNVAVKEHCVASPVSTRPPPNER
jgi:hypothetical protein